MKSSIPKFTLCFLCVCLVLAGSLSLAAFCYDPQNVYRWSDKGCRYFNPTYSAAGAVQNYDYDLTIIGSSMVQNFNAEHISSLLGCKPLKLTIGAMTPNELLFLYNCAQQRGCAKRYVINLDLHRVAAAESIGADSGRFPAYMFSPNGISQFKYLLGYETWFRFIPLDCVLNFTELTGINLPASAEQTVKNATDINKMCEWDLGALPGADAVIEKYLQGNSGFNEGDNTVYSSHAVENVDNLFSLIIQYLDSNESITIILPPYSVLYWADKTDEQLNTLLSMRARIAEIAEQNSNLRLLDFQGLKETTGLDNYYDVNHFCHELQALMENALSTDTYESGTVKTAANSEIIKHNAQAARQMALDYTK